MGYDTQTTWPGVLAHHADGCPQRTGGRCTCGITGYRARVDDPLQDEPVLGPIFPTVNEADRWRREQQAASDAWHAVTGAGETVGSVIEAFLDGIASGRAVDERGMPRPPEELSELTWALRALQGVEAAGAHGPLGDLPIGALDETELKALVARLDAAGLSPRRTRSVLGALRALLRFAAHRGLVPPSAPDVLSLGGPEDTPPATPTGMAAILAGPPQPNGATPSPTGTPALGATPAYGATAPYGAAPPTGLQPAPAYGAQPTYAGPPTYELTPPGYGVAPPTGGIPPVPPPAGAIPDEVIWMILKVVAIIFALIALVLAAESV